MGRHIDKNTGICFIDRTIPEVLKKNKNADRLGMIYLCWMQKGYGVDSFEIDKNALLRLGKLPKGLDFIYRLDDDDISPFEIHDIKKCIIKKEDMSIELFSELRNKEILINVEINATEGKDLLSDVAYVLENFNDIDVLRISNLKKISDLDFMTRIRHLLDGTKIKLDICAVDKLYMATAIAFEAVSNGADALTTTFSGLGYYSGYAAFEQVIIALKTIKKMDKGFRLDKLPETVKLFEKLTKTIISANTPILGKNIFRYEAGVHADGIQKNPATYEPFNPEFVGKKRKLILGKHSGKKAIICKLGEMGRICSEDDAKYLLTDIRSLSIQLGRSLKDSEIIELYTSTFY